MRRRAHKHKSYDGDGCPICAPPGRCDYYPWDTAEGRAWLTDWEYRFDACADLVYDPGPFVEDDYSEDSYP